MLGISCLWGSPWSGYTVHVYGVTQFSFLWFLRYRRESNKLDACRVGKGSVSPVLGWCCSTNIKKPQNPKKNHCEDCHRESIYGLPWLVNWASELATLDTNWQWEAQFFCYSPVLGSWNSHHWRAEVHGEHSGIQVVEFCFSEPCRYWTCHKSKEGSGKWTLPSGPSGYFLAPASLGFVSINNILYCL